MSIRGIGATAVVLGVTFASTGTARAIPGFARQTQMPCASCHDGFPRLNAFGRLFKLNAYTQTGIPQITARRAPLHLSTKSPLSVMAQASRTALRRAQPGLSGDDSEFPQQGSLFLAGEITPNLGTFLQVTYGAVDGSFGWDMSEIRYAVHTTRAARPLLVGLTLNNAPTVQDVWNTTPAWRFPFASPDSVPVPAAAALVDGALFQQAVGLGAYAFWNRSLYAEFSVYGSSPPGGPIPAGPSSTETIRGVAPYWRFAYERMWGEATTVEVGAFGLAARLVPAGIAGPVDRYTDLGFDAQVERDLGPGILQVHASWVRESRSLTASAAAGTAAFASGRLDAVRADATYLFRQTVEATVGAFSISGTADPLLYAAAPVTGSRVHGPGSGGLILEAAAYPWQNVRASAQYTLYGRFNGAGPDYDAAGRRASDNDAFYLLLWVAF